MTALLSIMAALGNVGAFLMPFFIIKTDSEEDGLVDKN
jgi:hypothetical protein